MCSLILGRFGSVIILVIGIYLYFFVTYKFHGAPSAWISKKKVLIQNAFAALAVTDCGVLHEETKVLLKTLAKRNDVDYKIVREAFQLELEKYSAYAVVSQLRQYIETEKWVGGLRL